jgi:hypothetical protein
MMRRRPSCSKATDGDPLLTAGSQLRHIGIMRVILVKLIMGGSGSGGLRRWR